jgi:hypothetical protein
MKVSTALAFLAFAVCGQQVSAIDLVLYEDAQCSQYSNMTLHIFNGVCGGLGVPAVGMGFTMATTCSSTTAASVTVYDTSASTNAPPNCLATSTQPVLFSANFNSTGCTPFGPLGLYAKINGTANRPCSFSSPAFFASFYSGTTCQSANQMVYVSIDSNFCYGNFIPGVLDAKLSFNQNGLTLSYWAPATGTCASTPVDTITNLPALGQCTAFTSSGYSMKLWGTSGAMTVFASAATIALSLVVMLLSL